MSSTEEYNIKKILFNRYHSLGKLCQASKRLNDLNHIVSSSMQQIHPALTDHCRIINYKDNQLFIETSRSEFLTTLKFATTDLITLLRKHVEFSHLITIKFKVNPHLEQNHQSSTPPTQAVNKPQGEMKKHLASIANGINNPDLKAALLSLIADQKA